MSHRITISTDASRLPIRSVARTEICSEHPRRVLLGLAAVLLVTIGATQPGTAKTEAEAVIHEACGDDPEAACVAELRKVCHRKMTMRCYFSRKERIDVKRAARARPDDETDPFGSFGEVGTDYAE